MKRFILVFLLSAGALRATAPIDRLEVLTVQDHYGLAMEAYQSHDWDGLIRHCRIVKKNYPHSRFADELGYYIALGFFNRGDLQTADKCFSEYLATQTSPKFFEEAILRKFEIAKRYEAGGRKHLFGVKKLPQWLPAHDEAIRLYDEVVGSMPRSDIAAESLYRKAGLLLTFEEYKESVDAYQTLIRRFPKHPLAPESFMGIASVYLKKCESKFPDPDYLDLAEINLRKFRASFPGEPRIDEVEAILLSMKEKFAGELYEIGKFYERTKKPDSAAIYYSTIIMRYPETRQASLSTRRLETMGRDIPREGSVAMPAEDYEKTLDNTVSSTD